MTNFDDPATSRSYRTTRDAYGYSLYPEKRNRDWLLMVGAVVLVVALAVVLILKISP